MHAPARSRPMLTAVEALAGLPHTPQQHFTLYFYAAVLRLAGHAVMHFGTADAVSEQMPFLSGYVDEIARYGLEGSSFDDAYSRWRAAIDAWERTSPRRLPLAALRRALGLGHDDLTLLAQIGLPDEDPRFGQLYESMQGGAGGRRATAGLLGAGWHGDATLDGRGAAQRLLRLGLVESAAEDAQGLRPCAVVWEAVRGAPTIAALDWARHRSADSLAELESLVLPTELEDAASRLVALLRSGAAAAVVLRGPRHNGRSTLAGALARRIGKGMLEVRALDGVRDGRWRSAAAAACLLDAAVMIALDPGPSERVELPDAPGELAPLFVTLGSAGSIGGELADRAITLRVPMPDPHTRDRLWRAELGDRRAGLARRRMTSGSIVRAARIARAGRVLHDGGAVDARALQEAVRTLERPGLEPLARPLEVARDWSHLTLPPGTQDELRTLIARCHQRERLGAYVGGAFGALGPGVRALFKGPSGTGKTLAARMVAGALDMELYRVDLAAVVNKYIGETEKNLDRMFARAEELDIVLLLDEGDALLAPRTGVQNANDRYANLETNYLLQRLESYEGILLVATNAGDRIDGAFVRRMDVVIDFPLPDVAARWAIWQSHLPATHEVDAELLNDAAQRCALSGGQIRNVALHASLLAAEEGSPVGTSHLESAIQREYRRQGGVSPIRPRHAAPRA